MLEVSEKPETGLALAEIKEKCIPTRIVNPQKEEWRKDLDSMPKRWAAILSNKLQQFPHDVTFSVGGETISCHKFVLSVASPFFEVLIENKVQNDVIALPDVDLTAFKNLIQQIYEGTIKKFDGDTLGAIFWGLQRKWAGLLDNQNGRFPHDLTFLIGDEQEKFGCHKFVLSAGSPVFEAMLADNSSSEEPIELTDISPIAFSNILKHVYQDDRIKIEEKDLVATMSAAHLCEIPELQKQCSERLQKILSINNAVTIFQVADKIKDLQLREKAHTFILQQFEDILDTDDFLIFTEKNLIEFLKSDDLVIYSEIGLFQGIIRWAEKLCETNGKEKTNLNLRELLEGNDNHGILRHIRILAISSEEFVSVVEPSGLFGAEDTVKLFKYFWQRKQKKNTEQQLKELKFSTSLRRCKLEDIVINVISDFTPRSQHEWNAVNFYCYLRFKIDGSEKSAPLFLKGIGFAGRTAHVTEAMALCVKVTPYSNQKEILSEQQVNFTTQANQVYMLDLANTVRIVPNTVYVVFFNNINGGLSAWSNRISPVAVHTNPYNSSKSIKLTVTAGHDMLYSLKFSHVE